MKILILSCGTRGDVLPFCGLGRAFAAKGCDVMFATHSVFSNAVFQQQGVRFADIGTSGEVALYEWPEGIAWHRAKGLSAMAASKVFMRRLMKEWFSGALAAARAFKPDLVVLSSFPVWFGPSICSAIGDVPFCAAHLSPLCETREFAPPVGFGDARVWFGFAALAKWRMFHAAGWLLNRPLIDELRAGVGLKPMTESPAQLYRARALPTVHLFSSVLVQRPADWPPNEHVVGSALVPEAPFTPPPALADFLSAGEPPVYCGFGSMLGTFTMEQSKTVLGTVATALAALAERGVRSILHLATVTGSAVLYGEAVLGALRANSERLFLLQEPAPHSWLFPRCALIVTHGGAGTVHAAVRAARPLIVLPADFSANDQPFWAGCVLRAGLGRSPCGLSSLGSKGAGLKRAILDLLGEDGGPIRERVEAAAQKMREEAAPLPLAETGGQ
eukprot:tig00001668_g9554.t1